MNPGELNGTDVIQVLLRISRRGESAPSHPTLGPWVGPQSAPPTPQPPSSARLKREEKLSGSALQRKRQGVEIQTRAYLFKHLPDWEEYIECYKEKHQANSKTNPFETRYVGLPQTFIALPHPEIVRSQARYIEDRRKYPIPVAYDRGSVHFKANSTPNLCILPGEGSVQLPPLAQKTQATRQEKKFCSSKNLLYPDQSRCQKPNYFGDTTLQALSAGWDVLKFDPPFDPRFKTGLNEMRNGNAKPFVGRPATSKKLEKLLVTCQNDSLNLENMIQSLCKSIPPARPDDPKDPPLPAKPNPPPPPAVDQLGSSLLDQFSYQVNKVDYDSPLDLQFNGRVYHTNLETFLQCLDTKLLSYSKASIEELMSSIHIHTITPISANSPQKPSLPTDATSAAVDKPKLVKGDDTEMSCKKFPVHLSLRKGNK